MKWKGLIVDDDLLIQENFKKEKRDSWDLFFSSSEKEVPDHFFHCAFVDMHLTKNSDQTEGLNLIFELRKKHPHIEIIAMSGNLNPKLMEQCLEKGASRYLSKPLNFKEIQLIFQKIESWLLLQQARYHQKSSFWIGESFSSQEIKKQIANLSGEKGVILIEGESGVGKEIIAQLLHQQENLNPFISLNVASIPENLFESEFFGYEKGAFTGAESPRIGLAEASHGGVLFLDEMEALSLTSQAKLLRFLETGETRRLGSQKKIIVNTKIIVATNENLEQLVEEKKFRKDLLWRINGNKITVPPLRKRPEDIKSLCDYFFSQDTAKRRKTLKPEALKVMQLAYWPGNVRELKRVCEQLLLTSPLPFIRKEDVLPFLSFQNPLKKPRSNLDSSLNELLLEFEAQTIDKHLKHYKSLEEARKTLKLSRSSLYKKIKLHNIQWK